VGLVSTHEGGHKTHPYEINPAMLRVYLFGNLRVFDGGQPLKLSMLPKTAQLWAYLLLAPEPTPRASLATALWPDMPDAEARGNLRRHLYDLRRALPPEAPAEPWLRAEQSVQWNRRSDYWLDVRIFEEAGANPAKMAEAVELYQGDLLESVYDDWIFGPREQLRRKCFAYLEQLIQQRRSAGELAQAIAYAARLLHFDPMREDIVRELMAMRSQAGDRSGALAEYQQLERRLRSALDVAPMVETQALYDSIARQIPLVVAAAPTAHMVELAGPPTNIPAPVTAFIGRERELAALRQTLLAPGACVRLLTLTGPGGSGKTRLAVELATRLLHDDAKRFPDGIYVVWLSTVPSADFVLRVIADTLAIGESFGMTLQETVKRSLAAKRMLLLLDNFEHVVDATPLAAELLAVAPGLHIVATSRSVLRAYGEVEFAVAPMPLPDRNLSRRAEDLAKVASVALFVARSRGVNPHFVLNAENSAAVAEICTRLDGLPLAIELAAARTKLLSPAAILARMENRLEFLVDRNRSQEQRHQTLRSTLDWSYQLLKPVEQQTLALLSVFAGGFSLEAAESVCAPCGIADVLEQIEALIDNSLLMYTAEEGEARFRMLYIIRSYARERLAERGDNSKAGRFHALYYQQLAEQIAPKLHTAEQARWMAYLETEQDNLRAALAWCIAHDEAASGIALVAALQDFWERVGHMSEGIQWLEQMLRLPSAQMTGAARAYALTAMGQLLLNTSDVYSGRARPFLQESIEISRQYGEQAALAKALLGMGISLYYTQEAAAAQPLLEESLAIYRDLGDPVGMANALRGLALTVSLRGDLATAHTLFDQCVKLCADLGDQWFLCYTLVVQASNLYFVHRDTVGARLLFQEALELATRCGDDISRGTALVSLADLAVMDEEYNTVEELATAALALYRRLGEQWQPPRLLRMLALTAAHRGGLRVALEMHREGIELNRQLGDTRGVTAGLVALADLAMRQERYELAARQLAAARGALDALHAPLLPADQAVYQRTLDHVRGVLDAAQFEAAWRAGATLTVDQAIDETLYT
jgi:predicted ATPase/DNA-binding SARP family transcriptional activator